MSKRCSSSKRISKETFSAASSEGSGGGRDRLTTSPDRSRKLALAAELLTVICPWAINLDKDEREKSEKRATRKWSKRQPSLSFSM